jgi:hypothetical protein
MASPLVAAAGVMCGASAIGTVSAICGTVIPCIRLSGLVFQVAMRERAPMSVRAQFAFLSVWLVRYQPVGNPMVGHRTATIVRVDDPLTTRRP